MNECRSHESLPLLQPFHLKGKLVVHADTLTFSLRWTPAKLLLLLVLIVLAGCNRSGPAAGAKGRGAKPNAKAKLRLQSTKDKTVVGAEIERADDVAAMIAKLKDHKSLNEIVLQDCGHIPAKDLAALVDFRSLKSMEFILCKIDEDVAAFLTKLPSLEKLVFAATPLTAGHFAKLADCRGLKHFALRGRGYSSKEMAGIKSLTQLRGLAIDRDDLDVQEFGSLIRLPALTSLGFPQTQLDDNDLAALPKLPNLNRFEFIPGTITDSGVTHISKFPKLESLKFSRTKITSAGLAKVSAMTALRTLDIEGCRAVTDAGVTHLLRCPALRNLRIEGTKITPAGFLQLAKLKSLRSIKVGYRQVTPADVAEFRKRLPNCKVIRLRPPPRLG